MRVKINKNKIVDFENEIKTLYDVLNTLESDELLLESEDMLEDEEEHEQDEQEGKKQQLILGRFQPFTIGHRKMVEIQKEFQNVVYIVIVEGKKSSLDKKRNPFTFEERKRFIKKVFPNDDVIVDRFEKGYLPDIITYMENKYKIPVGYVLCGEDRVDGYKRQLEKLPENHIDVEIVITPRLVFQTVFRNQVFENKLDDQKKLLPVELHDEFDYIVNRLLELNKITV